MLQIRHIYLHMIRLFEKHTSDEIAIESISYGASEQSILKLGRAQGVTIAAVLTCDMPVTEYASRKIT